MSDLRRLSAGLLALSVLAAGLAATPPAEAAVPKEYKNCTALNAKYAHGLGRAGAKDKTSGQPVTTFKKSTKLYKKAMSHNSRLDRDKDGIACEKR